MMIGIDLSDDEKTIFFNTDSNPTLRLHKFIQKCISSSSLLIKINEFTMKRYSASCNFPSNPQNRRKQIFAVVFVYMPAKLLLCIIEFQEGCIRYTLLRNPNPKYENSF